MFRVITLSTLLVVSLAHEITTNVTNGILHSNISTTPFVQIGDGFYYIETELRKNWFGAYENCRLIGAELITFNTMEEWNAVNQFLEEMDQVYRLYWTSGTNLGNKAKHAWFSNGQSISLDIWENDKPSTDVSEKNCDNFARWPNVGLNDDVCSRAWYYICEARQPKTVSFIIL